jgi:hypothetical protein
MARPANGPIRPLARLSPAAAHAPPAEARLVSVKRMFATATSLPETWGERVGLAGRPRSDATSSESCPVLSPVKR